MRTWAVVALLLLLPACAVRGGPGATPGAPAPAAAVERFLTLVGERDYVEMGWLFGTAEGPILERDPAPEVEKRMYALASVLSHDRFALREERPVPGRTGQAVVFDVELTRGARRYLVPFTVVRGPDGRWFVEQVGIEAITNTR